MCNHFVAGEVRPVCETAYYALRITVDSLQSPFHLTYCVRSVSTPFAETESFLTSRFGVASIPFQELAGGSRRCSIPEHSKFSTYYKN